MKLYPMVLTPFVSETVWGGRRLIDEYSVVTDKRNAAEAWVMSAHKNGSSTVANGEFAGKSLREVYLEHPELGGKNCAGFSDFPVLIKFIDAAADLSVQVHPDDAYCLKKGSGAGKTESSSSPYSNRRYAASISFLSALMSTSSCSSLVGASSAFLSFPPS